ncbi:hypothetical protein D1007_38772 [Hordeum vulgare]|nr:hypothetical protein D1007_38772 [Hordeum vulgare]
MACKQALQVAVDRNFDHVHVELDSKEVVRQINQTSNNLSALAHWVREIKELLQSSWKPRDDIWCVCVCVDPDRRFLAYASIDYVLGHPSDHLAVMDMEPLAERAALGELQVYNNMYV